MRRLQLLRRAPDEVSRDRYELAMGSGKRTGDWISLKFLDLNLTASTSLNTQAVEFICLNRIFLFGQPQIVASIDVAGAMLGHRNLPSVIRPVCRKPVQGIDTHRRFSHRLTTSGWRLKNET